MSTSHSGRFSSVPHSGGLPSTSHSSRSSSTSNSNGLPPGSDPYILPSTPPQDPAQLLARSRSLQSTKPNKGSGSHKGLLDSVTKDAIQPGVTVDMGNPQRCNPMDMVRFLLAFCCAGNSSDAFYDKPVLDKCFERCWSEVVPVANSVKMRERLEKYKSSAAKLEGDMYAPLSGALNLGLEGLSKIEVDRLPKFQSHIVFVPVDEGVKSGRDLDGSQFKPDVALMLFTTACDFRNVEGTKDLKVSEFVDRIPEKTRSKMAPPEAVPIENVPENVSPKTSPPQDPLKAAPSSRIGWKDILSAVEVKRASKVKWPTPGNFTDTIAPIINDGSDEKLLRLRTLNPETSSDVSQSQTLVTSNPSRSKKRTAADAGISSGVPTADTKRQRRPPKRPILDQTGIYAGEKLSDSHSISHALNLMIQDDSIWISWIDRGGAIISSRFSLIENLPLVLVLLLVLQRFGRRQWGEISELTAEGHSVSLHPVNADGTLGEDEVDVNFYPTDRVYSGWSLLGRATTVVGANVEGDRNGSGAAAEEGHTKFYDKTGVNVVRTTVDGKPEEAKSDRAQGGFDRARDAYRKARDDIIKAHNLILKISWPETSRIAEWTIVAHAQTLGETDEFIRGHIPEVQYGRDFDRYSTRRIRDFLNLQRDEQSGTRTLRLVVMNRLRPIHDLDGEQLWDAFWQCFLCHFRLWINGIHHGDISLNNLMYSLSPGGEPNGVLNDYDLASWAKFPTTNSDRTGTIPFMALDMLNGGLEKRIPRLYRHDAESFIWVLAYITLVNVEYNGHSAKTSRNPSVGPWFTGSCDYHLLSKISFPTLYGSRCLPVTEPYRRYITTIRTLMSYWVQLHAASLGFPPQGSTEPEVDDPNGALGNLIKDVEMVLGEDAPGVFSKVRTLLLEAIGATEVV